ncbi:GNAT family N-acetyltransferase [Williamsia sterculiae]|uniref:Predicted acetyltransferase n=1 Tax=Williamsia sterculiae TaxID=1344003 RepID=A0A1N7DVL9_9NOCA|nr:GNAT family N-acetyltransferase [Williamsia sterculiae]SIR79902.1 Predicted acetyltransferase [Williamsia sterculiae]
MPTTLMVPTSELHASWLDAWHEWGRETPQPGTNMATATRLGLDLAQPADFRRWVGILTELENPDTPVPSGMVRATQRWICVEDGDTVEYCGAINLRHTLTPMLAELGGHIGYSVRPRARRRGLAVVAVAEMLRIAGRLGLREVMITCDDGNLGSRRTIEKSGGALQDIREPDDYAITNGFGEPLRRYWVPTSSPRCGDGDVEQRS